jgi:hypothetical protein
MLNPSNTRRRLALAGLTLALLGSAPAGAEGPAPVVLAPHRAVYNLSLLKGGEGSGGIESAQGRIAFDFAGDACEGYTLRYRQVTVLDSTESGRRTLDVRTATFEAGDGLTMRFRTDSEMEGVPDDKVDGEAEVKGDGIAVRLREPRPETLSLPARAVFPTEHMKRILEAARAGKATYAVKMYDGSDTGKKMYDTLALIGRRIEPGAGADLEAAARQDALAKLPRWPVKISYFVVGSADQTPAYTISFELYENGISRALQLDYGDFILKGDLQSLDVQASSGCQR